MVDDRKAIRSSYKVFMDSIAGKDFLQHLLTLEMTAQSKGIKATDVETKAMCMENIGAYYNLRTYLADMSKPAPSAAVRSAVSE